MTAKARPYFYYAAAIADGLSGAPDYHAALLWAERALAASEATVADLRKKLAKSQEARAPAASPGGGGGGGGGGGSKKKKGGKK